MQNKVLGPAIGLIVLGVLGIFLVIPEFMIGFADPAMFDELDLPVDEEILDQLKQALRMRIENTSVTWNVVLIVLDIFIVVAGVQMLSLKSWTMAVVANILLMITCLFQCCCCPLGLPIGIWGLIVLFDSNVKQAFEGKAAG